MTNPHPSPETQRARELRAAQTKTESLLWQVLRGRNLCDLKFRRQHPIGPYFADFACEEQQCVIEIDGGYHENTKESDDIRQNFLKQPGWKILRFSAADVATDVEAVAIAIARHLGLEVTFRNRKIDIGGARDSTEF